MLRISNQSLSKMAVSRFRALATAAKPATGAKAAEAAVPKVEKKVAKGPKPIRIEPFVNGFPNMKKAVLVTDLPIDITAKSMADRLVNLNIVSLHMQPGCTLHFRSKEEAESISAQLTAAQKHVQVKQQSSAVAIECDAVSDINAFQSILDSKAFSTCLFKEYTSTTNKPTLLRTSNAPPAISSVFPEALKGLGEVVEVPRPALEITNITHLEIDAIHALLSQYNPSRVYIKRQLHEGLPISATITFASVSIALTALQGLHDTSLDGKRIGIFYRELIDPCVLVKGVTVSDEELKTRLSTHLSLLELQTLTPTDTITDVNNPLTSKARDVLLRFGSDHDANIAVMALNGRPDMKDMILTEAIRRDTGDTAIYPINSNTPPKNFDPTAQVYEEKSRDGRWHFAFPSVAQAREAMTEIIKHAKNIQLQSPPTLIARSLYAVEVDGLQHDESVSSLLLKLSPPSTGTTTYKSQNTSLEKSVLKTSRNVLLITKRHEHVESLLRALRKMRDTTKGAEIGEKVFKHATRYIPIQQQDESSSYDHSPSALHAKEFEDHVINIVNPSDIKRPFDDNPAIRYSAMLNAFEERLADAVTQEDTDLFFGETVYDQLHPYEELELSEDETATPMPVENKKKVKKVMPQALIDEAMILLQEAASPWKQWQAAKDINKPIPTLLPPEKFERLFIIFQHLPENIASAQDFADLSVLFGKPPEVGSRNPLSWAFSMYSADFEPRLPDALLVKRNRKNAATAVGNEGIREELLRAIRNNLNEGIKKVSEVMAIEDHQKQEKIKEKAAKERMKLEAMGMFLPSLDTYHDHDDADNEEASNQTQQQREQEEQVEEPTDYDELLVDNSLDDDDDDDKMDSRNNSGLPVPMTDNTAEHKQATTEKAMRNQIIQNRKQLLQRERHELDLQIQKEEEEAIRKGGVNQFNPAVLRDADGRLWSGTILDTDMTQKTLPGGRLASHRALVVIGNLKGTAGFGMGKANEPGDAIDNAFRDALKNLVHIDLYDNFGFAHDLHGKHNSCHAYITATPRARVMIASDFAREVLYKFGVGSASVKLVGRRNPYSMVRALFNAIQKHENIDEFAKARGKRYLTLKWLKDQQL